MAYRRMSRRNHLMSDMTSILGIRVVVGFAVLWWQYGAP